MQFLLSLLDCGFSATVYTLKFETRVTTVIGSQAPPHKPVNL